ncbi:Uncharacterized protein Fot_10107 [Forsythia ovata]|uniref:Uncharacterized protein n=1 Tax=Forsythia ovata TaxID=205694 RepID=A0ABD1WFV9_9LAMI
MGGCCSIGMVMGYARGGPTSRATSGCEVGKDDIGQAHVGTGLNDDVPAGGDIGGVGGGEGEDGAFEPHVNTRTHPCAALGTKVLTYSQFTSSSMFSNSIGPDLVTLLACSSTIYGPLKAYSMNESSHSSVRSIKGHLHAPQHKHRARPFVQTYWLIAYCSVLH